MVCVCCNILKNAATLGFGEGGSPAVMASGKCRLSTSVFLVKAIVISCVASCMTHVTRF